MTTTNFQENFITLKGTDQPMICRFSSASEAQDAYFDLRHVTNNENTDATSCWTSKRGRSIVCTYGFNTEYSFYYDYSTKTAIFLWGKYEKTEMREMLNIEKNIKKFFTKKIKTAFEKQGYCGNKGMDEIKIICKLFNPSGGGTWYLYEKINEDVYMAFCDLGDSQFAEIGTVSVRELAAYLGPYQLSIERDKFFDVGDKTLKEIWDKYKG